MQTPAEKAEYNRKRYAAKRAVIRAQTAAYRAANPDKVKEATRRYTAAKRSELLAKNRAWRAANPEKVSELNRQYRALHREELSEYCRNWRGQNQQRYVENIKTWQARNYGRVLAYSRSRKARQRSPAWADTTAISLVYQAAEVAKMTWPEIRIHVDHEIPLRGRNVSGLHVHNNLRIVTARENLVKNNHFEPC